jgi:uncharacterized protein
MILGVISDTHGTVRPEALNALRGVEHIVHAGDVGGLDVIEALETIAPVTAVRGNTDGGSWSRQLQSTQMLTLADWLFYVLHDMATLDLDPAVVGINAVISGHTHQASIKHIDGVLCFNPGSASQGRHGAPASVGRIQITPSGLQPQIVALKH